MTCSISAQETTSLPSRPLLKTVLVVDDDPVNLLCSALILQKCGCTSLIAHGPDEAIELFNHDGALIDLLVTVVDMPKMSGYELAEFLRKLSPRLPALYMSAASDNDGRRRNCYFIRKPFTWSALIERAVAALHSYPPLSPDGPEPSRCC